MDKKVAITTLGCKANQLESSIILDDFIRNGWEVVNFKDKASVYIINTCTVTGKSDNTSRYYIRQAKRTNQNAKIVVTGCYAQIAKDEVAMMKEVDFVIGNSEKQNLFDLIQNTDKKILVSDIMQYEEFVDKKVFSAAGRTRVNIKVQDGCNYRCSYCIIPYARGKSRSNKLENIIEQVKLVVDKGFQEVIFTGIHLGQWGLDFKPKQTITDLLKELDKIEGLKRYRLGSLDPREITDEFIEVIKNSEKFCRHLHISLQSVDDTILKNMRRPYNVEHCITLFNKLSNTIADLAIGSDIIVGFPGETDEQFMNTYKNVEQMPLSYLHVFPYSRRKGTPADKMSQQILDNVKKQRAAKLRKLALKKNIDFRKKLIGKDFKVVAEFSRDKKTGKLRGITDNYIPVIFEGDDELQGQLVKLKIKSVNEESTSGDVLQI